MAASSASLALTDRYRDLLLQLRFRVTATTARTWGMLDPGNLDESYADWRTHALAVVQAAKVQGVAQADAYLAAYLASETGREVLAQGIDPEPYMDTEDGRSLAWALTTPLLTVKMALARGDSGQALQLGLHRAARAISGEVMGAPRRALHDLMEESSQVKGKRRVTSANACGACLALADGQVMDLGEHLRVHGHCRCITEPVVKGVRERVWRPTGRQSFDAMTPEEQAALFHGRGGAEKAELLRSGAVPFAALVCNQDQAVGPPTFTEAPMSALRQRTHAATA